MKKNSNPYNMKEFKNVDLLDEISSQFPFLKNISSEKELRVITQLIEKLANAKYETNSKYNILWDVIQLVTLIEPQLPETITDKVTLSVLDSVNQSTKLCNELTDRQQWCLFKIARNIVSDSFHIIYEDKTRFLIDQVILLCQGHCVKSSLSELSREVTKISRGENVAKILNGDKVAQTKLFQQVGYFLERAKGFSDNGNPKAACMALVGAGSCCRFIMIGKMAGGKILQCVGELNLLRSNIVHRDALDITGESLHKTAITMSGKTDENIVELAKEAQSLGLELDVKGYIIKEKPTEDDESPRGYEK